MPEAQVVSCCTLHLRFMVVEWSGSQKNCESSKQSLCLHIFYIRHITPQLQLCFFFNNCYSQVNGGSGASFPLYFEKICICIYISICLDYFYRFSCFLWLKTLMLWEPCALHEPGTVSWQLARKNLIGLGLDQVYIKMTTFTSTGSASRFL